MQSYSQVFGAAKIKFSMHLCQQFTEISIDASAEYLPKLRQILQIRWSTQGPNKKDAPPSPAAPPPPLPRPHPVAGPG